jgi:hypothetical protein
VALKDLVSDLSNFKTKGDVAYDKLDPQIKNGVDYIPNTDAPGFTPKTDLKSLYVKANSPVLKKIDNPFVPASDGQLSPKWSSTFPTQFKNGFFPIANAVSNYNPPKDTLTHFIEPNISTGPEKSIFEPMLNTTQELPIAHGSNFTSILSYYYSGKTDLNETSKTLTIAPNLTTGPTQPLWIPGLNDTPQIPNAHGSEFMVTPIKNFTSKYDGESIGAGSNTLIVPKESFRIAAGKPGVDTFKSLFSVDTTKSIYNDSSYIKDLFEFRKDGRDTFKNVPNGMNDNGNFGTADFRKVANSGPFSGNDNHPLILREVGNEWGFDANSGLVQTLDQVAGGFVRGAPGITGLVDRSLQDKVRIGRFMFTTNLGLGFIAKQFILQALNPTIESKVWNPASALSLTGVSDLINGLTTNAQSGNIPNTNVIAEAVASAAISAALPIGHPERHLPNIFVNNISKYSQALELVPYEKGKHSRLAFQSKAFSINTPDIPSVNTGNRYVDAVAAAVADSVAGVVSNAATAGVLALSDPNRYGFPISSAPKSLDNGIPSFTGTIDLAERDVIRAKGKGVTFNPASNASDPSTATSNTDSPGLIKRHSTLAYSDLKRSNRYEGVLIGPKELNEDLKGLSDKDYESRIAANNIVRGIGNGIARYEREGVVDNPVLGVIKGNMKSANVDKVNIHPYGSKDLSDNTKDFIKFRFKDVVNNKFMVFRAILEGITDSITPDYGEEQYIGRPDNLYVYKGVTRQISFTFSIYPKTKQELPVLMEKVNYLIGMCYPSYTTDERMITPFMELTMGDMFVDTPGILSGLTMTVEENSTWEIEEGLQLPHYIKAACEFKHIGKYIPASKGKHYDLNWLPDGSTDNRFSGKDLGFNNFPYRGPKNAGKSPDTPDYRPLFEELSQVERTTT